MPLLRLTETGRTLHRLTADQGRALATSGLVTATESPYQAGLWEVASRGRVGVARIGDVEVWITPKLDIHRLLYLVGYATDPRGWRQETVAFDTAEGLVPAVADALCRQAEQALRGGLLQGYRTVEETSPVLRGRLRETEQLRRHHGRIIPMEIRHDDFTADIAENQILLAAITRLGGVPRVSPATQRRLAALRARLFDVSLPVLGTRLPSWQPNRLNHRYHIALRLAEVVWQATSPEHTPGSLLAHGFLFDLWRIFEDFVTTALSEELHTRYGGSAVTQYPCHLDTAHTVRMKPDLVWRVRGRPAAVIDAKYKQEQPGGYPDADLYQVLAYCTALDLPRGHLVYARGNADPARHVVRHADIEIVCHALDLEVTPTELLAQVARIADGIARRPQAA